MAALFGNWNCKLGISHDGNRGSLQPPWRASIKFPLRGTLLALTGNLEHLLTLLISPSRYSSDGNHILRQSTGQVEGEQMQYTSIQSWFGIANCSDPEHVVPAFGGPGVHVNGVQRRYTHMGTPTAETFSRTTEVFQGKSGHAAFRKHRDWQRVRAVSHAGCTPRQGTASHKHVGFSALKPVFPSLLFTFEETSDGQLFDKFPVRESTPAAGSKIAKAAAEKVEPGAPG